MMHDYRSQKFLGVFTLVGLLAALMASNAAAETLEQAWAAALAADHGLKASRDNSAAAASQLAAAKSAHLPALETGADYFALTNLPELKADLLSQSFQIPLAQRNSVVYDATATLPIYTGGRIEHGIAAASSSLQAARLDEVAAEQNLRLRVAEAYVNVLRASRLLDVAENHVTSLEAHASDVDNLLQQGMASQKRPTVRAGGPARRAATGLAGRQQLWTWRTPPITASWGGRWISLSCWMKYRPNRQTMRLPALIERALDAA